MTALKELEQFLQTTCVRETFSGVKAQGRAYSYLNNYDPRIWGGVEVYTLPVGSIQTDTMMNNAFSRITSLVNEAFGVESFPQDFFGCKILNVIHIPVAIIEASELPVLPRVVTEEEATMFLNDLQVIQQVAARQWPLTEGLMRHFCPHETDFSRGSCPNLSPVNVHPNGFSLFYGNVRDSRSFFRRVQRSISGAAEEKPVTVAALLNHALGEAFFTSHSRSSEIYSDIWDRSIVVSSASLSNENAVRLVARLDGDPHLSRKLNEILASPYSHLLPLGRGKKNDGSKLGLGAAVLTL